MSSGTTSELDTDVGLMVGSSPTLDEHVVLSFLGKNFLPTQKVDLGQHALDRTMIESHNIHATPYTDLNEYNFKDHAFQTLQFNEEDKEQLTYIFDKSLELEPASKFPDWTDPHVQRCIHYLEDWIMRKYTEMTGEQNIQAVCSTHLIFRIAGCDKDSCQIPGNPLFHLDYISFDSTYDRHCLEQEQWAIRVHCPPKEQLIDVVNVWFPTTVVQDWPLGFINKEQIDLIDYIPIQIVSGSMAASLRYKDGLQVTYKDHMEPGEVYMFRSATESPEKKGLMHGSFRITSDPIQRRSIELRCLIFRKINGGTKKNKMTKNKTRKYKKRV